MTVLNGLLQIQDEADASLVFRYACRWAVCGSCAMLIDRKIRLACRTQLADLKGSSVRIEPLPGLKVIKDLVVDMEPFWQSYRAVKPWVAAEHAPPEREQRMHEAVLKKIEQFVNCILCGACYSACPVVRMDGDRKVYLGPAALAKANRFIDDPRGDRGTEIPAELNSVAGVWGCHQALRCNDCCPKKVRPSDGIMALRRKMLGNKFKRRETGSVR